jgi:hypothetical protein
MAGASKNFSWIQSLGSLSSKLPVSAPPRPSNGSTSLPLSPSSMAPPRAWLFNSTASALRLTPIGHEASAISKLASAGSEALSTKGVRCLNPSPCSPLILNPALPLKTPKPTTMTASGSLGSSLCAVSYPRGRPLKDVSGSQVPRRCAANHWVGLVPCSMWRKAPLSQAP